MHLCTPTPLGMWCAGRRSQGQTGRSKAPEPAHTNTRERAAHKTPSSVVQAGGASEPDAMEVTRRCQLKGHVGTYMVWHVAWSPRRCQVKGHVGAYMVWARGFCQVHPMHQERACAVSHERQIMQQGCTFTPLPRKK